MARPNEAALGGPTVITERRLARLGRWALAFLAVLLLAAGLVVGKFADTSAHWSVVVRPVVVAMVAAAIVIGACFLLRQSPIRSAAITIGLLLAARGGRLAIAVIGLYGLVALWFWVRQRRILAVSEGTLAIVTAAFFGAGVIQLGLLGVIDLEDITGSPRPPVEAPPAGPSIYLLILDGYARQDTLASMGFDNGPFLGELERLGFDVYRDSRSNYTWTGSTLASMLNLRPLDAIPGAPQAGSPERIETIWLRRAINRAAGLDVLGSRGYRVVSVPSISDADALLNADEVIDSGQLREFEVHLLQSGPLASALDVVAPDFIGSQHRERIRATFAAFAPRPAPTFMLAHVLSPHHPFVVDAEGRSVSMPACFPGCWFWAPWDTFSVEDYFAGYLPQVSFVNGETIRAMERLISADPNAVIIVMGDHGSRAIPGDEAEKFRNLLAVRSPGHPRLLGAAPTPVNLLGSILHAYLGIDVPRWPDAQFSGRYLDARRIAPVP